MLVGRGGNEKQEESFVSRRKERRGKFKEMSSFLHYWDGVGQWICTVDGRKKKKREINGRKEKVRECGEEKNPM